MPEQTRGAGPDAIARLLRRRCAAGALELEAGGRSMEPAIPAGAIVTVVHDGRPRPGAVSAFVGEDGRLVVHRFRRLTPQGYVFRGDANAVDDAAVPIDRYVGRVTSARDGDRVAHFGPGDRATARVRHRLLAVRSVLGRQRRRLSKYLSRSSDPPAQRPQ